MNSKRESDKFAAVSREKVGTLEKADTLVKKLKYYYRRYEFATSVNVLEPWERRIVNTAIFTTFAVILFSTGYYLPQYINSLHKVLFSSQ